LDYLRLSAMSKTHILWYQPKIHECNDQNPCLSATADPQELLLQTIAAFQCCPAEPRCDCRIDKIGGILPAECKPHRE